MNDSTCVTSRRADAWAVLAAMVFPSLLTWLYFCALGDRTGLLQRAVYGGGKVLQFAFPLLWVWAVGRHRPRWTWPRRAGLAESLGFGVLALVAILGGYYAYFQSTGSLAPAGAEIARKITAFGLATPARFAAMGLFYAAIHSLGEEYYWRWFVFGQLRRWLPLWMAIVLASLAFMAHHVILLGTLLGWSPLAVLFSLAVAIAGAAWCWTYQRSGSLWGPWLSHALADAAIFAVGYALARDALGW